jgi:hypothetical protein
MSPFFENAGEFIKRHEPQPPHHGDRWGNWRLDAKNLTLEHLTGDHLDYDVDLEKMNTSAEMLDWIFQVRGKAWASDQDMGDLLTALDELLKPQVNLCSGGRDCRFDASKHLQAINGAKQ